MTKFFLKKHFIVPFCPNMVKNKFSPKVELCQFLDIKMIKEHAKIRKANEPLPRNMPN